VVGITANHFAERFDKSAHHLDACNFQAQSKGGSNNNNENVPNMNTGSLVDSVRRGSSLSAAAAGSKGNIRNIVEHRSKSAEAAESHVSWLDNLRKEISQFPHASSSSSSSSSVMGSQQVYGDTGGSSFGAQFISSDAASASAGGTGARAGNGYGATHAVYRV
jgi:hypothetical protein